MDIKKAMNRIAWRFGANGNKNPFPINEGDIEAFNEIVKVVKEHQENQYRQNELFAKLYIFVYMRFISKMGMTVMDTEPRKAIHKILQKPLMQWVEEFKDEMNNSDLYETLKKADIDLKLPAFQTDEERTSNIEKLRTIEKEIMNEVWDFETTKECLEIEINNALNFYK